MKRTGWNMLMDFLAATCFLGMVATGYLIRFPLPPGTQRSLSLWGLTRHEWGGVHFWISLAFLVVLVIHVALHWQWVVSVVARKFGTTVSPHSGHLTSGLITFAAVVAALGAFAWAAEWSVKARDAAYCPREATDGSPERDQSLTAEPPPVDDGATVEFWADVYPIFKDSCLGCHGPRSARAGFRVDRRDDFFRRNGRGPFVVPGQSDASPLIAIVSGQRPDMFMANRHRLPEHEVAVVRRWIDAGARWSPQGGAGQPSSND